MMPLKIESADMDFMDGSILLLWSDFSAGTRLYRYWVHDEHHRLRVLAFLSSTNNDSANGVTGHC